MPLPAPAASWSEEILEAAREMMNAVITIRDPDILGEYDPVANTQAVLEPGDILVEARAARIQHIQAPRENGAPTGWSTERRVRFQFEILDTDPPIRKGAIVEVLDGGRDPQLEEFLYHVVNALNSSHAALRTVEASTEA